MSGVRGQNGPLTLRCRACERRNVGAEQPISPTGKAPARKRSGRKWKWQTEVRCFCGWTWWTTHASMIDRTRIERRASNWQVAEKSRDGKPISWDRMFGPMTLRLHWRELYTRKQIHGTWILFMLPAPLFPGYVGTNSPDEKIFETNLQRKHEAEVKRLAISFASERLKPFVEAYAALQKAEHDDDAKQ